MRMDLSKMVQSGILDQALLPVETINMPMSPTNSIFPSILAVALLSGCDQSTPVAPPLLVKPKVVTKVSPSAKRQLGVAELAAVMTWKQLPEEITRAPAEIDAFGALETYRIRYWGLSAQEFLDATRELLVFREVIRQDAGLSRFIVILMIEELLSEQIPVRISRNELSLSEAKQIHSSYALPVFSRGDLLRLIGYPAEKLEPHKPLWMQNLVDFTYEQAGGEDRLFEGLVDQPMPEGKLAAWWHIMNAKSYFQISLLHSGRRETAALGYYLLYLGLGGDPSARPLYEPMVHLIPDILTTGIEICPGIRDSVIHPSSVESLLVTKPKAPVGFPQPPAQTLDK